MWHVSSRCYLDAEGFRRYNLRRCCCSRITRTKAIALIDECRLPETKRFLRLLALDLMIEADKLRRGDGAEALLVIENALRSRWASSVRA